MKLVIGIATRGRPNELQWTIDTTVRNCTNKHTKILVHCDTDDASMDGFEHEAAIIDRQPRPDTIAGKWNRMLKEPGDVYLMMVDYRAQVTKGFDQNILDAAAAVPDGIVFIYQHMANLSFPAFQAITRRVADVMGHFYVEYFPYWFVDHWLDDLARMTGRIAYAEGDTTVKPRPDGGTQEMREPALWASLFDALFEERNAMAEKLLVNMDEPWWRRGVMRSNYELIHQRSRLLNTGVREMPSRINTMDERYMRLRNAAVKKIQDSYFRMKEAA